MPFYRIDLDDGRSTIVHMRLVKNRTPQSCPFKDFQNPDQRCGRLAVALCDFPVAKTHGGAAIDCDLPMCERHRTSVGPDRDHCPKHVTKEPIMTANEDEKDPTPPTAPTPPPLPEKQGDGDGGTTEDAKG